MLAGRQQGDGRGQVAAGAVAADREPGGVDAKLSRVRRDPPRARVAVLHGRGELVLGRQPVAHRHGDAARRVGDHPADPVAGVQRAQAPAAAEEVDEDWQRPSAGPVDARRERPSRAGNLYLPDLHDRLGLSRPGRGGGPVRGARLFERQRGQVGHLVPPQPVADGQDLRVQAGVRRAHDWPAARRSRPGGAAASGTCAPCRWARARCRRRRRPPSRRGAAWPPPGPPSASLTAGAAVRVPASAPGASSRNTSVTIPPPGPRGRRSRCSRAHPGSARGSVPRTWRCTASCRRRGRPRRRPVHVVVVAVVVAVHQVAGQVVAAEPGAVGGDRVVPVAERQRGRLEPDVADLADRHFACRLSRSSSATRRRRTACRRTCRTGWWSCCARRGRPSVPSRWTRCRR